MKSVIALALILDFSGSMHQKILEKPKVEILKSKLSAMTSSFPKQTKIHSISFGSNKNNKCGKVSENLLTKSSFKTWLKKQEPIAFSMTPLTEAIEKLGAIKNKQDFSHVLIITDGSDTCGRNPCEAIVEVAKKYKEVGAKMEIDVIGYDIKDQDKKLNCYVNNLGNVRLQYYPAKSDLELKKRMSQINNKLNKKRILSSLPAGLPPRKGLLEIKGAPDDARFQISQNSIPIRNWEGSFQLSVSSGEFEISLLNKNSKKKKKVNIKGGESTVVSYEHFVGKIHSKLITGKQLFPTQLVKIVEEESDNKKDSEHVAKKQKPKATIIPEKIIHLAANKTYEIDPGKWKIRISSPWWLNGPLDLEIELIAGESRKLDLSQVYQSKIDWISPPKLLSNYALILTGIYGGEHRILVQKQTAKIPIPQQWSWYWIEN